MQRSFVPQAYWPSSPRSGNEGNRLFRIQNMIARGDSEPFAEVYGGSLDLNENIPTATLTGTASLVINSTSVVGVGTVFTTELHLGQFLLAYNGSPDITVPLVVDEITDDTHFTVTRAPYATTSNCTIDILPVIFEVNKQRGTLIRGNAVQLDLGTILCVGDGVLLLNGAPLPGASLTASRSPQIAIFDQTTGNYSVYTLGMSTPTTLSAVDQAGGTKNMQIGTYSIRAVPSRQATNGYNNPSPKAEVSLAVANHVIRGTFPAANTTNGQDMWTIFGTLFTQGGGINGPWYLYKKVNVGAGVGEIPAAGGTYDSEWNDAEISGNDLLSFNNDQPPNAEFVGMVGGIPVWISCQGPGGMSPGPFVVPAKANNIEAAPLELAVSPSPPDTIIGAVTAQGRLYLMCTNTLQIGIATQATDPRIPPMTIRPFWRSGFKNPYQLLFVDGTLVGATNHGLARSIGEGDESATEFNFAVPVNEVVLKQNAGHQLLALDPKNNAACLLYSGDSTNDNGFWTTRVLMYGMREQQWIGDIRLSSDTGDMIVSGVATVNGQLEFLCGGRQTGGAIVVRTYRWDQDEVGQEIDYYAAWQYSDWGAEVNPKRVSRASVVARQKNGGTLGIHGAEPGERISVSTLEAGNNGSKSGAVPLTANTDVLQGDIINLNVRNLKQLTARVDGKWPGTGERDRIDEVVLDAYVEGARR